ncbi:hypothetical protein H9Y04_07895 [Streptomyces sp. TRM66268-LWL]|uniref:Uncharacterized protein n=1 Tax=Streptomyces polyasparticus TaxID=2767826 RepID=A0ABR7SAH5_9ACTN|nr:hypothetical protein [Streptomyces polyasparticus]MBC9712492.1 hypothetical protein [Streptomyces polyasparticus]
MSEQDSRTTGTEEGHGRHRGPAAEQDVESTPAGRHRRHAEQSQAA